jgi:PAS domain S-box-containing protein
VDSGTAVRTKLASLTIRAQLTIVLVLLVITLAASLIFISYRAARRSLADQTVAALETVADTRARGLSIAVGRLTEGMAAATKSAELGCDFGRLNVACAGDILRPFLRKERARGARLTYGHGQHAVFGHFPDLSPVSAAPVTFYKDPNNNVEFRVEYTDAVSGLTLEVDFPSALLTETMPAEPAYRLQFVTLVDGELGSLSAGQKVTTPPAALSRCLQGGNAWALDPGDTGPVYRVYRSTSGVSTCVIAEMSQATAMAPITRLTMKLGKTVFVFTIGALLVAYFLGYFLTRPLEMLKKRIGQLKHGDFDSRVPIVGSGEIRDFSEALASTTETLRLSRRALVEHQAELKRLAQIVESSDEAIGSLSLDGRLLSWNRGAQRLYGYSAAEMVGQTIDVLLPEDRKTEYDIFRQTIVTGKSLEDYETLRITKAGERKPVSLTFSPLRDESGQIVGMSAIARDLTQIKRAQHLEEQLRQAQKLESLGRLTGGVAHDFNNLLMVISSYTEMLDSKLGPDHPLRRNTQQVLTAATRAASLTQQMLAFSRKQVLSPQVLNLNTAVNDTATMLKRMIGEDIELKFLPSKLLWSVMADPGQMTQVLMNLGVNARDAMPKGGKLTIETHNVVVDAQTASRHPDFSPGSYVMIAVSDTGSGMTKDVQERIFEPFFTTKEKGKGTGLGLSTVYGIVKQSGGYIWVYSEVGKGSCFKLYFPKTEKSVTTVVPLQFPGSANRGETILLVEDEDSLRESVREYLRLCGYEVLEGANGQEALEVAERHLGAIHLLLTDVIMPKMNGPELARELSSREGMAVLFMSGYTDDAIVDHGVLEAGAAFLQKPFSLTTLGAKVRNLLDSRNTKGQEQSTIGPNQMRQENPPPPLPPAPVSQLSLRLD